MSRPRLAFTLIEVLVATAIGMLLVSLAWAGFNQVQQVTRRQTALVRLHSEAAAIQQALGEDVGSLMQTCMLRLRAFDDGVADPALRKAWVEFTAMRLVHSRMGANLVTQGQAPTDQAWFRWRWDAARGTLSRGITPEDRFWREATDNPLYDANGRQYGKMADGHTWWLAAHPRRDRQRDLNDDDGRWQPVFASLANAQGWRVWDDTQATAAAKMGAQGSLANGLAAEAMPAGTAYAVPRTPGDDVVLSRAMGVVHHSVTDFRIGWVDRRAATVLAGPIDTGSGAAFRIVRWAPYSNAAAGAIEAGFAAPVVNTLLVDGAWLDARVVAAASTMTTYKAAADGTDDAASIAQLANGSTPQSVRPALLRVAFTLSDADTGISQDFSYSFPTAALLPAPPPAKP